MKLGKTAAAETSADDNPPALNAVFTLHLETNARTFHKKAQWWSSRAELTTPYSSNMLRVDFIPHPCDFIAGSVQSY